MGGKRKTKPTIVKGKPAESAVAECFNCNANQRLVDFYKHSAIQNACLYQASILRRCYGRINEDLDVRVNNVIDTSSDVVRNKEKLVKQAQTKKNILQVLFKENLKRIRDGVTNVSDLLPLDETRSEEDEQAFIEQEEAGSGNAVEESLFISDPNSDASYNNTDLPRHGELLTGAANNDITVAFLGCEADEGYNDKLAILADDGKAVSPVQLDDTAAMSPNEETSVADETQGVSLTPCENTGNRMQPEKSPTEHVANIRTSEEPAISRKHHDNSNVKRFGNSDEYVEKLDFGHHKADMQVNRNRTPAETKGDAASEAPKKESVPTNDPVSMETTSSSGSENDIEKEDFNNFFTKITPNSNLVGIQVDSAKENVISHLSSEGSLSEHSATEDSPTKDSPTEDSAMHDSATENSATENFPTKDSPTEDSPTEDSAMEDSAIEDYPTENFLTDECLSSVVDSQFIDSKEDSLDWSGDSNTSMETFHTAFSESPRSSSSESEFEFVHSVPQQSSIIQQKQISPLQIKRFSSGALPPFLSADEATPVQQADPPTFALREITEVSHFHPQMYANTGAGTLYPYQPYYMQNQGIYGGQISTYQHPSSFFPMAGQQHVGLTTGNPPAYSCSQFFYSPQLPTVSVCSPAQFYPRSMGSLMRNTHNFLAFPGGNTCEEVLKSEENGETQNPLLKSDANCRGGLSSNHTPIARKHHQPSLELDSTESQQQSFPVNEWRDCTELDDVSKAHTEPSDVPSSNHQDERTVKEPSVTKSQKHRQIDRDVQQGLKIRVESLSPSGKIDNRPAVKFIDGVNHSRRLELSLDASDVKFGWVAACNPSMANDSARNNDAVSKRTIQSDLRQLSDSYESKAAADVGITFGAGHQLDSKCWSKLFNGESGSASPRSTSSFSTSSPRAPMSSSKQFTSESSLLTKAKMSRSANQTRTKNPGKSQIHEDSSDEGGCWETVCRKSRNQANPAKQGSKLPHEKIVKSKKEPRLHGQKEKPSKGCSVESDRSQAESSYQTKKKRCEKPGLTVASKNIECGICLDPVGSKDKHRLQCGHDQFHYKCISDWVNQRKSNCPICRESVEVNDLSVRLSLNEYPHLGAC